ncbi:MAG: discoidin domain-containing protein [Pseudanabaena sp. ELA645]
MFTPPIISKTLAVIAFTAFMSLSATSVSAINITGVTASTDMGSGSGGNIENTVNGAGLPSNIPSLTGIHVSASTTNAWVSVLGTRTGNIDFNLGGSYDLSGFSFWNFIGGVSNVGIKDVSILTSTDGSVFTSLAGAPTQFAQGVSSAANPQTFTFSPTTASFVRFAVASNYGNANFTGFSEVQFDSAATPVPFDFDPSLGVVGLGVVFGINKWRKNKNKDLKK